MLEWAQHKRKERYDIINKFSEMIKAQELALSELQIASQEKYNLAVKVSSFRLVEWLGLYTSVTVICYYVYTFVMW